jgi:hypothetical protein
MSRLTSDSIRDNDSGKHNLFYNKIGLAILWGDE